MRDLLGVLFPVLSGRVDAAVRIRGLEVANANLVRENARLRRKQATWDRHVEQARTRLAGGAR